jgi:MFS family permease
MGFILTNSSIILRAFQGIGGSGTYSLIVIIFYELVPPEKFASYTSMVSGVLAIGMVTGPLFGGLINNYTTWRWIFLFM